FWQPDVLGNTLVGDVKTNESSYALTANTVLPAQALVWLPKAKSTVHLDGKVIECSTRKIGDLDFAIIDLPKGTSRITINMEGEKTMAPTLESFRQKNIRLVGFGDSNTDFNHWSFGRNWLSMLACNGSDFFGRRVIINSGVSGDNTADALRRVNSDVLDFHPDIVIVAFGLNDALQSRPLEDFKQDYRTLLEMLKGAGCYVITRTSQPIINMTNGTEELATAPKMPEFMAAIVEISRDMDIPCVDHYSLWKASMASKYRGELVLLMGNRLHPNEQGHRRLYSELAPFLNLDPDFQCEFMHLLRHQ
ncbi:MAG: SGNH/GDSL hydrolase family protein, partial [Victivallales bacterium]|nr:SGNH/GDSL hydrolase family protein [Victivallales bacterium]